MVDSGLGALVFAMDLGLATVPRGQGEVSVFTAVDVELDKFVCVDAVVDAVFFVAVVILAPALGEEAEDPHDFAIH